MASGKKLSHIIRDMIGRPAPVEMLDGWDEALQRMAEGEKAPKVEELIAMKVLKFAVAPGRANQWAVELVFDRVDGKAIQQAGGESRDVIEERLDDISRQHLNDLAALSTDAAGGAEAEDGAGGPVANPLGALSSYRPPDSEGAGGEPEVEDEPPEEG